MHRTAQGLVRLLALLAGLVAGLQLLAGIVMGVKASSSTLLGLLGVLGVPLVLVVGTMCLLPRAGLRRRLRSVAVVLGTTGCGVGLVATLWPILGGLVGLGGAAAVSWLRDGAAAAVCSSGALLAILAACAVLDDGERAVP